jgi:FG-GAP repeat
MVRACRPAVLVLCALVVMTGAASARAVPASQAVVQRLDGDPGHRIGNAVATAGDVDGDGRGDLVVGAALARPHCERGRSDAYVVFTRPGTLTRIVGDSPGFSMRLARCQTDAGGSVSGAGDVNGDGHDDVIVGAPRFGRGGAAFVVFGSASTRAVDLDRLGPRGFRIDGGRGDAAGAFVAAAGDVNGDGRDDVAVGTDRTITKTEGGGVAYVGVVFGSSSRRSVDLRHLGDRGFRIRGYAEDDGFGTAIAGVGDLNRDGRDDLVLGAPRAPRGLSIAAGRAFVVYGSRSGRTVRTRSLGARGYTITGDRPGARAGGSVAAAGDFNGDGITDIMLGSHRSQAPGRTASGQAWIVFGTRSRRPVDLRALGGRGLAIEAAEGALLASSVGAAGDVDGDGLGDVVLAAPGVAANGPGRVYVIHGTRTPPGTIDLASATSPALAIDGLDGDGLGLGVGDLSEDDHGQQAVGAIGDLDGDGRSEIFAAAAHATYGGPASGSVYLLRAG